MARSNAAIPDPSDDQAGTIGEGDSLDDLRVPGVFDQGGQVATDTSDELDAPEPVEEPPAKETPPVDAPAKADEDTTEDGLTEAPNKAEWDAYIKSLPQNARDAAQKAYDQLAKNWQGAFTKARQKDSERVKTFERKAQEFDRVAGLLDPTVLKYLANKEAGKPAELTPAEQDDAIEDAFAGLGDDPTWQEYGTAIQKNTLFQVKKLIEPLLRQQNTSQYEAAYSEGVKEIEENPVLSTLYPKYAEKVREAVEKTGVTPAYALRMLAFDDAVAATARAEPSKTPNKPIPRIPKPGGGEKAETKADKYDYYLRQYKETGDQRFLNKANAVLTADLGGFLDQSFRRTD